MCIPHFVEESEDSEETLAWLERYLTFLRQELEVEIVERDNILRQLQEYQIPERNEQPEQSEQQHEHRPEQYHLFLGHEATNHDEHIQSTSSHSPANDENASTTDDDQHAATSTPPNLSIGSVSTPIHVSTPATMDDHEPTTSSTTHGSH